MISFSGSVAGQVAAQAAVSRVGDRLAPALERGVRVGAARSVGIIRGNASGRPGPRVITGDFRRSITDIVTVNGLNITVSLGSAAPQAARLENPFYGPDSLDRRFAGTTYPWLRPSIGGVSQAMTGSVNDAVAGAL